MIIKLLTMTEIVKIKRRAPPVGKTFRLLDFVAFDDRPKTESSSDDDSVSKSRNFSDTAKFTIQIFGVNEAGETCAIFITDFTPFFYVKVDDFWTASTAAALLRDIRKEVGKFYELSVLTAELVEYQKLYGFTGGRQDKFVKFTFKNTTTMNRVKNMFYIYTENKAASFGRTRTMRPKIFQNTTLEIYESNIPPLLRYFHIQNISPSGWVFVPAHAAHASERISTTCTYEYSCLQSQLRPLPEKETPVPYKICSFDIEASSSHGDFPLPVKTYKRLASNIIDVFASIDTNHNELLRNCILTAFSYSDSPVNNIDLVYPKIVPSVSTIRRLIDTLLSTPLENAKKMNDEDNSHLLTIDSIFDQIKETCAQTMGSTNTAVVAEDNDSDDEADDEVGVEAAAVYTPKKRAPKVERSATIIDVLVSTKYEREEKVQLINEVLTMLFPRLMGDTVTFIGSTFLRSGDAEPYMNHCLVVGSCDPVPGAIIESVDDECSLLLQWTALIQRENPDIIIGYNIFGFDYEFMFRRAEENHCCAEFLLLSRKKNELSAKVDKNGDFSIENSKIVLATGEYDLRYPKITGRVQIDMYAYFRRDFNLSSYKLDDVAGQFISDDIKKIVLANDELRGPVTELYSQNLAGLHVGDFIHIELSSFTSDYYKDGHKFPVIDIVMRRAIVEMVKGKETEVLYNVIVIAGHEAIDMGKVKSIKWTMAKDDVTPQDIFRLAKGSSADRAVVAKYCIQDCNLVHHLMKKIDVITGYVEMARICSVPISFLVFRGQGVKLTSYVAKKCMEKKTLMPDLEQAESGDKYEGAIVLPPKCSMYMDNPVACVDYASLYPSSMISQNLSHDSKVWTKEYDLDGTLIRETGDKNEKGEYIYDHLPGYEYIHLSFDTYRYVRKTPAGRAIRTKAGKMTCCWAQFPDNKKGIMPSILEELLKARADTRKKIKTEKDPFMQNILDKRQLGYKVTANSLYGQCGARTSTFYEKDIAASTTATGRMMIIYAKRIIEEVYGDHVYETACHGPVKCKAEYVYGDSVASYTPIYVRKDGAFDICQIDQLFEKYGNGSWTRCLEAGKQDKEVCELDGVETWTERGWTKLHRVIRHILAPHKKMIRILSHTGLVDVTDDHSLVKADGSEISPKDVVVGTELLHHDLPDMTPIGLMDNQEKMDQIGAAHLCWLASKRGLGFGIENDGETYRVVLTNTSDTNAIKKMHEIQYDGYVYDLTTENHHFAAGIGKIIVHNTDSVFFTFNLENVETGERVRGKPALEMTIEIAQDAALLCTRYLKSPMELSYEKTMMPFILLSKKRYVGMLYETDANKGKLKYMGLSLKRRDSCDYLKDVYGGILNILMKQTDNGAVNNIQLAIEFLDKSLNDLIDGRVPMDKLTLTRALRGDYKNPTQMAHRVLADRIGQRDPGNKPKPGDRIKFAFIVNNNKKALQGDKIETPEFIISNKLQLDYVYYITNQLMKPLQQLFGLALEHIWTMQRKSGAIKTFKRDMERLSEQYEDLEEFMKKKEKYCSAKVKLLLFDKFLTRIFNQKNNIQQITGFFASK